MEPGGDPLLLLTSLSLDTRVRLLELGLGEQIQGTRLFLPHQDQTSNVEPGTCGCAPCSGSHGSRILELAPSYSQCSA